MASKVDSKMEGEEEDFETVNAEVFRLLKEAMRKIEKKGSTDTNDGDTNVQQSAAKTEVLQEPAAKRLKPQEMEGEEDFETVNADVFRLLKESMREIKKKESTAGGQDV